MLKGFEETKHFFVLMLENRSFDHMFAYTDFHAVANDPSCLVEKMGLRAGDVTDPDPPHEYHDVHYQLTKNQGDAYARAVPCAMNGFEASAKAGLLRGETARTKKRLAGARGNGEYAMQCQDLSSMPMLERLAEEFVVCTHWFSSMPGPTWPNRFFAHAATSGGLDNSPAKLIPLGRYSLPKIAFSFEHGTIYDRLGDSHWRVYYEEGLPQVLAIKSMVSRFLSLKQIRASRNFRKLDKLEDDLKDDAFSSINYIFIEPKHDTFNDSRDGNSQHPMGTISAGEELIKKVYEIIRNSAIWEQSALIITYDEHGGFYDCMPPADATPPGDDMRNHSKAEYPGKFDFNLMGVRVPAIVVSPWVETGVDDKTYDHTSILRTLEDRFGLKSLTERDTNANGLGHLFSRELPRIASDQAPTELPAPNPSKVSAGAEPSSNDETYDDGNLSGNEAGFLRIAVSLEHILSGTKWGVFGQLLDAVRDRVFPRFARTTMVPNLRSRSEVREYVRRMEDRVATLQQQR